ncbi:MAG: SDR family oxidoreductase, partial [Myxococcota bacterium]
KGKVVVVTGANSGIGLETARALAREGAHVVMTARDEARGEIARRDVQQSAGHDHVDLHLGDFTRLSDVRRLGLELRERYARIDVLVNNAGLILDDRRVTEDGHEATFQVNHLAPFLLTALLLPSLRAATPARIVNVSSGAHPAGGPIDFDDLMATEGYSGFRVYARTKLANILFTKELSRRYAAEGISSFALHPGAVATGFARDGDTRGWFYYGWRLITPFLLSPARGARTSIHCARAAGLEVHTGRYFVRSKPARTMIRQAEDPAAAALLWERSEALVSGHLGPA